MLTLAEFNLLPLAAAFAIGLVTAYWVRRRAKR